MKTLDFKGINVLYFGFICDGFKGRTDIGIDMVKSYCEEMGKKSEDIEKLAQTLKYNRNLYNYTLKYAAHYYGKKYGIDDKVVFMSLII